MHQAVVHVSGMKLQTGSHTKLFGKNQRKVKIKLKNYKELKFKTERSLLSTGGRLLFQEWEISSIFYF